VVQDRFAERARGESGGVGCATETHRYRKNNAHVRLVSSYVGTQGKKAGLCVCRAARFTVQSIFGDFFIFSRWDPALAIGEAIADNKTYHEFNK
jgi:hypothetical protein